MDEDDHRSGQESDLEDGNAQTAPETAAAGANQPPMSLPIASTLQLDEDEGEKEDDGAAGGTGRSMSLPLHNSQGLEDAADDNDSLQERRSPSPQTQVRGNEPLPQMSLPLDSSMRLEEDEDQPPEDEEYARYESDEEDNNVRNEIPETPSRSIPPDENSRISLYGENSRASLDNRVRFGEADDTSPQRNGGMGHSHQQQLGSSLIWGTQVDTDVTKADFRRFLHTFKLEGSRDAHYIRVLDSIYETKQYNLNINCADHLCKYSERLYKLLVRYPQEIIPLMDLVVHEEYVQLHRDDDLDAQGVRIQVRLFKMRERKKMRDLDPENIDQLVSIEGMIIRCSPIIPDMKQGFFRCQQCNHEVERALDRGRIEEPKKCLHCATALSYVLVHNRCLFADKQTVKIQETPENVSEGETPYTCTVMAYDSLVDVCKPGDRVTLTGILRATPVRVDPRKRTVRAVYKTHLDVIHVSRKQQGKLREMATVEDGGSREFNREFNESDRVTTEDERLRDEAQFEEMARNPNLYEDLAKSLAPSIYELVDVKKGLLLQMMGGTNKRSSAGVDNDDATTNGAKASRTRGEINILLCGDPGTSKSQLLSYVHRIAPRGIYTSGKGSSAVGLTAYITKDPDSKELVLESGALVLSDRGVCCIDEFDKMNDATRAILHEVMEQQTISLAKAGIICTLNARTSILASANPVGSRYDPRTSVVENLKLPPTLLSRFDLIYLILDRSDPDSDRKLARHIVQMYRARGANRSSQPNDARDDRLYDMTTLSRYIAYAREKCRPMIGDVAKRKLVDAYVEMRRLGNMGGGGKKTIVATPRQLESFVRLSEARAKLRLSNEVSPEDVDEAVRLFNVATHKAAMDPRTGTIDMDALNTGIGSLERMAEQSLVEFIKSMLQEQYAPGDVLSKRSLMDKLNERPNVPKIERNELDRVFDVLNREQVVVLSSGGMVRVC